MSDHLPNLDLAHDLVALKRRKKTTRGGFKSQNFLRKLACDYNFERCHMRSNEHPQPVQTLHGASPTNQRGRVPALPLAPDRLIRLSEACALAGVGKTSVYSIPDFPRRVQLSRRAVGWRLSEIQQWIESRVQAGGQS
jgi:prophage regulatory protein